MIEFLAPGLVYLMLGYLSGSLPFAIWVTRWRKGVDVRNAGSGHATATNTIRQAGWAAGALVLALDIAKGFLPVWLAVETSGGPGSGAWAPALAAAGAVLGHCWPVFAGFRGGMGLAVTGGAMLATAPMGFVVGLGMLVLLVLVMRHSARAAVFTGFLLPPVVWLAGIRGAGFWVAVAAGAVVAVRFLVDWNRKYRELWLDREKSA